MGLAGGTGRWTLARAGITNVYQYGDEVLHFGRGRLLLRGVNGSGKSTAMNMLLPFLLEADTRRIDAAGEQAGVLRSWMLSGRDEPQPVGYLWIEFRRGGEDGDATEYLTCGCGIRANRSTDRVTTWWFVTHRRPHVDLTFVEGKTPIGIDALRAELGPNAVFAHDQRGAYRAEVRNRLFGGADLDQHLRLLHVVRNPRVGDRIDVDLPLYLEDALPQLSEAALDDAAQPLEDLEEHRRNVEDLGRTATALDALDAVYREYARTELHSRADHAVELAGEHRAIERKEHELRAQRAEAEARRDAAVADIDAREADQRRLRHEIETLKGRDAYKAGADLTDLRAHVASLTAQLRAAEGESERRSQRRAHARDACERARSDVESDRATLRDHLDDLSRLSVAAGLAARPPDAPAVDTRPADGAEIELATSGVDVAPARRQVAQVRAASHTRGGDVREVRGALRGVDQALAELAAAERDAARAAEAATAAAQRALGARATRDDAARTWRAELDTWIARLSDHRATHGIEGLATFPDVAMPDLVDRRAGVSAELHAAAQHAIDQQNAALATLGARLDIEQRALAEAEALAADLQARALPDPPRSTWQGERGQPCVAELVDFHDHVTAADRTRVEAAMEAAGLLAAELRDGGVVLAAGQLVACSAKPVEQPLSSLLVALPAAHGGGDSTAAVQRLLDTISIDPDLLDADDDHTVVTIDGRFRTGVLRGRHRKEVAEHIGVSARRASLERQRAVAEQALAAARYVVEATEAERATATVAYASAVALRDELPSHAPLTEAVVRLQHAEATASDAAAEAERQAASLLAAEAAHAAAVDELRRIATSHGLPHEPVGLDRVERDLREVTTTCDHVDTALTALARAVAQWLARGGEWETSVADDRAGAQALVEARREHEQFAIKLATLEDTVGAEYDEIVRTIEVSERDLLAVGAALDAAQDKRLRAHGDVERLAAEEHAATEQRIEAEHRCVAELAHLRAALAVPGLLASAAPEDVPAELPIVEQTPAGLRELAGAIRTQVPGVERAAVTAESVRQSLRQRRDSLGAGWDAEDRQPDETLPLHVEVTGPLARTTLRDAAVRVHSELRSMSSLLSAKQDQALRNLLQGLIAREVAEKLHAARELVARMNRRLDIVKTSHGIGVSLRWQRREDLDESLAGTISLLAKPPDLRMPDEDRALTEALSEHIADARREDPDAPYRDLITRVLDYRAWHRMGIVLHRPGRDDERLTRRTALSEGEKKMVSYLPLFAAVAASCDALAEHAADAPRFVLLDDAFAKVSEDNHPKLFGLLVELDLDFIATSERLWGTHATVPELAITEVLRDADLGVIVLEHSRWDGRVRVGVS